MGQQQRDYVAPELRELLMRIWRETDHSYRRMAERADLGPDVLSRVAGGRGGMSSESCRKFAAAYGEDYHFSEDDVLRWAGHRSPPKDGPARLPLAAYPDADLPRIVRNLLPNFQDLDRSLDAEYVDTVETILSEQIGMLKRLSLDGRLPPTRRRAPQSE